MITIIRTIIILIICTYSSIGYGQFSDNFSQGTRSLGMGGVGTTLQGIDAMRSNQAGLVYLKGLGIGLHTDNRYLLSNSNTIGLDIAKPTKYGVFGLSLNAYGNTHFKQQKIGFAYARKLFKNLSIGGQFDVFNTSIDNYGSTYNVTFEVGVYSEIFPKLHAAAHIFSPGKVTITDRDPIPGRVRVGLKYLISDKLNISSEFDKNIQDDHDIKAGIEYNIIKNLHLRLGITTREGSYSFGFSYLYKKYSIDLGMVQHTVLGTSPGLSIKYGIQ